MNLMSYVPLMIYMYYVCFRYGSINILIKKSYEKDSAGSRLISLVASTQSGYVLDIRFNIKTGKEDSWDNDGEIAN